MDEAIYQIDDFDAGGGRALLHVSSKNVATWKGLWHIMDEPYVLYIQYRS